MYNETILSQTGGRLTAELSVPRGSGYFDGHFAAMQILPAAAQAEIVLRLGARYLGSGLIVVRIKRLKFAKVIEPEVPLHLELVWAKDKQLLSFRMTDTEGDALFSSGSFVMGDAP